MTNADDFSAEGGCTCGEIRYRMTSKPIFVHCCNCRYCQRETGSSYAFNSLIESDRVELLSGEPMMVLTPSASGKGQKIWRCPICFVAVWSNYAGAGDKLKFIRTGTLDNPDLLSPDIFIYTGTKQRWVTFETDKPVFEDYYPPKDVWPEEALARWRALQG